MIHESLYKPPGLDCPRNTESCRHRTTHVHLVRPSVSDTSVRSTTDAGVCFAVLVPELQLVANGDDPSGNGFA